MEKIQRIVRKPNTTWFGSFDKSVESTMDMIIKRTKSIRENEKIDKNNGITRLKRSLDMI